MSYQYSMHSGLDLYVKGRGIQAADAERQARTAGEILSRLQHQPGVILADEVGTGKTFVALAVAASVALDAKTVHPVVVMVPRQVLTKWVRDVGVFREHCLPERDRARFRLAVVEDGVGFLRKLDDPDDSRASIVLMPHGAMSRRLADAWVQLAILQAALAGDPRENSLLRALGRSASALFRKRVLTSHDEHLWERLLARPSSEWRSIVDRVLIGARREPLGDDPVPALVLEALQNPDTRGALEPVRTLLQEMPLRQSKHFDRYMLGLRRELVTVIRSLWTDILSRVSMDLPLLIMDEAHHLKNPNTELASLFASDEARDDADQVSSSGPLAKMFERMLFMTATPFQLGHHELLNVLSRFDGIAWSASARAPSMDRAAFTRGREELKEALDAAQRGGIELSEAWGRLSRSDVGVATLTTEAVDAWWRSVESPEDVPEVLRMLRIRVADVERRFVRAASLLRPWVIRHNRSRCLPDGKTERRVRLHGSDVIGAGGSGGAGLRISAEATLPFLLAGRLAVLQPTKRPVFAEGLASSYEAFVETRAGTTLVDDDSVSVDEGPRTDWYRRQIGEVLADAGGTSLRHPKLDTTVDLAMQLWEQGEKVLIFCHYIATGRALRARLSERMIQHVETLASKKLGLPPAEAMERLETIRAALDKDAPAGQECQKMVMEVLSQEPALLKQRDALIDVALRFIRTPGFVVRFFDLAAGAITPDSVATAFSTPDRSGLALKDVLKGFFGFLAQCVDVPAGERSDDEEEAHSVTERQQYIDALLAIQTGTHIGKEADSSFTSDEVSQSKGGALVANVRLANGGTSLEARQRFMLAFNTPFFPDILVASSVLAEGVDLHLNCRHVIHHDLSWNPSALEQRTGRVDRIGARAEQAGKPIYVYLPYLAETQDEKMYRVVMDRESWFETLMGKTAVGTSAEVTDREAERVPFPTSLGQRLKMRLDVGAESPNEALPAST